MRRAFAALILSSAVGNAQSVSASLSGVVEDAQSLRISGAAVTITNRGTNAVIRLATDGHGAFRVPSIAPGDYTVTIEAPGFARHLFESVPLTVGQSRSLAATLQPAAQDVEITVQPESVSEVATDSAGNGRTFSTAEISDIPNISGAQGRSFRAQVHLTPGVAVSTSAHRPFAVSGARNRNNSYQIDSSDYNEIEGGLLMGRGVSEQLVSVEALAGIQVLTHNYKAEYGRNNGAIVSMVTRQGTNEWHGSVYDYVRNDASNARNTFDLRRPALKSHQPGFTIGGPVRKNSTFLFGNFESYLRSTASTSTIQTLTPEQRARAAAAVRPLAALYPEPNIEGTNLFRANVPIESRLHTYLIRADHNVTSGQRIFARSIGLDTFNEMRAGAALSKSHRDIGSLSHSLHHSWAAGPRVLNEARFQFTRFHILDTFDDPVELGDPAVNGAVGQVAVPGLTMLGHFPFMAQRNFQNSFQLTDDLSIQRGRHALKTGVAVRRQQLNSGRFNNAFVGQLRFLNVNQFLEGSPASYSRNAGNPFTGLRTTELNVYFQDDWQIHPSLMLNAGLRYELNTVPVEVNGLIPDRYRFAGDHNNFAPRFSIAWKLPGLSNTVLRGGYGIYYNVLEMAFVGLTRFNPPLISNLVAANPSFPGLLDHAQTSIPSGLVIPDRAARTPYAQHFLVKLDHEAPSLGAVVSVGYTGTASARLPRNALPNGGDGLPQEQRPDSALGVVNQLRTDAMARYHGLETSISVRRGGFIARGSYTLGKSLDPVSDYPSSNTGIERQVLLLDEGNMRLNRGPSDFDIRHMATFFYSYDLPLFGRNPVLGGWVVQGTTTLLSGRPYTIYSGTDTPFGSNSNRILHLPGTLLRAGGDERFAMRLAPGVTVADLTPARGAFGTIGRNTERGDSLLQWNLSLGKTFAPSEGIRVQFRAEAFNVMNTVNYDLPDGVLNSRNFGQALTAFDSRQLQLGLKLTF